MSADKPNLVVVAQVAGAFGVRGEVRVRSFTEDPEACFDYGPLLDETGACVLTAKAWKPHKDVFNVRPKEVRQREEWEAMKGLLLHVPREAMPETDDDEYYVVDLVGCSVLHRDGRALGVVRDVQDFGAGDLLEVKPEAGNVYYLPFGAEAGAEVNLAERVIVVDPPEDFLPEGLQRQASDGGTN